VNAALANRRLPGLWLRTRADHKELSSLLAGAPRDRRPYPGGLAGGRRGQVAVPAGGTAAFGACRRGRKAMPGPPAGKSELMQATTTPPSPCGGAPAGGRTDSRGHDQDQLGRRGLRRTGSVAMPVAARSTIVGPAVRLPPLTPLPVIHLAAGGRQVLTTAGGRGSAPDERNRPRQDTWGCEHEGLEGDTPSRA
jgi:hypothetical protein